MEEIGLTISRFIDNDLSGDEQKELFIYLAEHEDAREMLNDYMSMKKEIAGHYNNLDVKLNDSKIALAGTSVSREKKFRLPFYTAAAAVVLLGFLLLMNIRDNTGLGRDFAELQANYIELQKQHIASLEQNIKLEKQTAALLDAGIKNSAETEKSNKPAAVSSKTVRDVPAGKTANPKRTANTFLAAVEKAPVVKITRDDFITTPLAGN